MANIGSPVTIFGAFSCTFSNFLIFAEEQPLHKAEEYSNISFNTKVKDISVLIICLYLKWILVSQEFLVFAQAMFTLPLMYADHFKSSENVRSECLKGETVSNCQSWKKINPWVSQCFELLKKYSFGLIRVQFK